MREDGLLLKRENRELASSPQVRIVVSKKVARLAVKRNRIRRVLREATRKELEGAGPEKKFVLIVLPEFDLQNAREIVRRLFLKASRR